MNIDLISVSLHFLEIIVLSMCGLWYLEIPTWNSSKVVLGIVVRQCLGRSTARLQIQFIHLDTPPGINCDIITIVYYNI